MKSAKEILESCIKNQKGQGMVEYVLTITSISLVAMLSMQGIGTWLDSIMGTIATAI